MNKECIAIVPCLAALMCTGQVQAQTGEAGGATQAMALEEIIVTARRTQESMQDVPVAITAFSAEDLSRENINTVQDLLGRVNSLVMGPSGTTRNAEVPAIRGQGATFNASPGVVMYWAEVPLPGDSFTNNQGGPGMFFDLENLQVLKGPQGTLFGRNTTGGALLLEPAKPQDTFSARVQAETGNYDNLGYEAVLNLPLVPDRLLLRLGGQKMERDGFTDDVVTGVDYDNRDYWTARLGLTLYLTDNIENTFLTYHTRRDENGSGAVLSGMNSDQIAAFLAAYLGAPLIPGVPANEQFGCQFFNSQAPSTSCGQDMVAEQEARDIRNIQQSPPPKEELDTGAYLNLFSWALSDELTLRNILSHAYYEREFNWDQDGSRAALNDISESERPNSDTDTVTAELQLLGDMDESGLSYAIGIYYEKREPNKTQQNRSIALFVPSIQEIDVANRSKAIYAQGTYDLAYLSDRLDAWTITAGARYTEDRMWGEASLSTPVFVNNLDEDISEDATTWTVGLDYRFDRGMAYGKVSRGYKSGGFTALAANPNNYFYEPEYVTSYEIGAKSDLELFDRPLRLNAAIYYSDYEDMQRSSAESYQGAFGLATFNSGESEIKGFEMDFALLVTDNLRLSGNYSYTDGEFEEFLVPRSSMTPQLDCTGAQIQDGAIGDYSCIPFTDMPEHQFSLSALYTWNLDPDFGTLDTSVTYSWVDERYLPPISVPEAEPGAWLEDFHLVNASIDWRGVFGTSLDLQLFGTNLTDEEYRISNSNVWNELGYHNSIWGEPRMYGLRATYRWGEG